MTTTVVLTGISETRLRSGRVDGAGPSSDALSDRSALIRSLQFGVDAEGPGWGHPADRLIADVGTRAIPRLDLTNVMVGTMRTLVRVVQDPAPRPIVVPTQMTRIRRMAGLSLREWAPVFGVTHTAIKGWLEVDPDRPKLRLVVAALEDAARYHGKLAGWLQRSVAGTEITPLDLLRLEKWRAFSGAVRSGPAPTVTVAPEVLYQRIREGESWLVPEPPGVTGD